MSSLTAASFLSPLRRSTSCLRPLVVLHLLVIGSLLGSPAAAVAVPSRPIDTVVTRMSPDLHLDPISAPGGVPSSPAVMQLALAATPEPTTMPTPTATPTPTALPGPDEVWLTPGEGGELVSSDGRVEVDVPPGAVTRRTLLRYLPQPPGGEPPPWLLLHFGLEARDEQGVAVTGFETPVSLTYRFPAAVAGTSSIGQRRHY